MSSRGKEHYVTLEGLQKLQEELETLKTTARSEVADRIREAKEAGDISENSAYDEAKRDQAFVEGRIRELEQMLRSAVVITQQKQNDRVGIGHRVTICEKGTRDFETYTIVGSAEAEPNNGRISNVSPLGSALLNARVGDVVAVQTPNGVLHFEIKKIE